MGWRMKNFNIFGDYGKIRVLERVVFLTGVDTPVHTMIYGMLDLLHHKRNPFITTDVVGSIFLRL